ncbi:MAG: hypothetical protein HC844_19175, partial [Tabrizicola sp.]|nr:hypothetical protein [Tabrizicola sp.]
MDIPAGTTNALVIITPFDDATTETNETVTLTISPHAGYGIGASSSLTALIADNDFPRLGTMLRA